jgi:periplasmic protein TonB
MKTKTAAFQSWDDLVFENRNQAYGAYPIRKAYADRVLLGFGVTVAFATLILLLPRMFKRDASIPDIIDIPLTGIVDVLREPVIERQPPPSTPARRPERSPRTNTTIEVVREQVETPVDLDFEATFPDTEGLEGVGSGLETGTGPALIETPPVVSSDPLTNPQVMPAYEGGMEGIMKFIRKKLHYPATARRQGIEGTVFVSFVVNGDGSVSHVTVLRGIHRDCDEEASRVIGMLDKWKGGMQGGIPVRVRMVLPIKFSLQ